MALYVICTEFSITSNGYATYPCEKQGPAIVVVDSEDSFKQLPPARRTNRIVEGKWLTIGRYVYRYEIAFNTSEEAKAALIEALSKLPSKPTNPQQGEAECSFSSQGESS
jgi:hypothetical protein